MKKTLRILAAIMVLALSVSLFAACGGGDKKADDTSTQAATEAEAKSETADVDYSKVDLTIENGDYDAMSAFLDAWGENKYDNKVIKITGKSEHRMSNCTILEEDANGTGRGCSWEIIDGKFPDDYPADGAIVTVTGVLTVDDIGARKLMVPAENVEEVKGE